MHSHDPGKKGSTDTLYFILFGTLLVVVVSLSVLSKVNTLIENEYFVNQRHADELTILLEAMGTRDGVSATYSFESHEVTTISLDRNSYGVRLGLNGEASQAVLLPEYITLGAVLLPQYNEDDPARNSIRVSRTGNEITIVPSFCDPATGTASSNEYRPIPITDPNDPDVAIRIIAPDDARRCELEAYYTTTYPDALVIGGIGPDEMVIITRH